MLKQSAVKFYAVEKTTGKRRIFSFKVANRQQAIAALKRFNVPFGYYCVYENGRETKNQKISCC